MYDHGPRNRRAGWEDGLVSADLLALARAGDGDAFGELVEPYRHELQVHHYA